MCVCVCIRKINLAKGQRQTGHRMTSSRRRRKRKKESERERETFVRVPLGHGFITGTSKCVQVYLLRVTFDQRSQGTQLTTSEASNG